MKVMVIVKANADSEAGRMPDTDLLAQMGKFNEALVKAGILLAGEGLHPTSRARRGALERITACLPARFSSRRQSSAPG